MFQLKVSSTFFNLKLIHRYKIPIFWQNAYITLHNSFFHKLYFWPKFSIMCTYRHVDRHKRGIFPILAYILPFHSCLVSMPTVCGRVKSNVKPLQNKKDKKNLGYPRKKQSFYKEKDCLFLRYPTFFWPFLFWSGFI